jgi:hypothetical protein
VVYLQGNVQKTAILINILRWQVLVINLQNRDVIKRSLIAKFLIVIAIILLIFSSYVMTYIPANIDQELESPIPL